MVGAGPIRDNDPRTAALELQQQLKVHAFRSQGEKRSLTMLIEGSISEP